MRCIQGDRRNDQVIFTRLLTPDEVVRLIEATEPARRDPEGALITNNYRLIVKMAVGTGLRAGELLGLRWCDLDWKSVQVHVRRSWKDGAFHEPKTKTSTRAVPLEASLLRDLRAWRLACPKGANDLVFPNLEGKPMGHANLLQRGFFPALRRAGLRKIRFHDLRHSFASLLLASGEDVVRVSRLLGHASPKITLDVYSHALPTEHYATAERIGAAVFGNKMETSTEKRALTTFANAFKDAQVDDLVTVDVVARGGIEPPTRGFSVRCSTN